MKKRKEFEYKINGLTKNPEDFKDYITYESILLETIRLRRYEVRMGEGKCTLNYKILGRIRGLYEMAAQRFSNNLSICLEYFTFCQKENYINAASLAVTNLLQVSFYKSKNSITESLERQI